MTQRKTNPFGKSTTKYEPYAVYRGNQGFTWCILKTYKRPDKEASAKHARWFGRLSAATDEWREHYPNG